MRVLIAVDGSEYSEIVLEHGLDQASRTDARDVDVVIAVGSDIERRVAARWLRTMVDEVADAFHRDGRDIEVHVRIGDPVSAIGELARDLAPDLLVIGRFGVPSRAEAILETIDVPTLVVGIAGHELEPQCPACSRVRRATDGERLFCDAHAGDRVPDLVTRLPISSYVPGGFW
jgi:nucleotide-binding universal stress UspA family protein